MKTFMYISVVVAMLGLYSSCTDFLDKEMDTEVTMEMIFDDRTRMQGWLAQVYAYIPRPAWSYIRHDGYDTMGDEVTPSERWQQWWGGGAGLFDYYSGAWSAAKGQPGERNYWVDIPKHIRTAYVFMERAKALPNQGIDEKEVEYMKAECRFIAAYYWYRLLNAHGVIPFRPNYIAPTDADVTEVQFPQVPFDEVVDWLDKELLAVSQLLPAVNEGGRYGRATSIMCLAVRARMLLFAASPLVNGNEDYDGYTNKEGKPVFNSSYDADKWQRASVACKELIDAAQAAGHALYIERTDGVIDPFLSCQNLWLTSYGAGNREILFARPRNADGDYQWHSTPRSSDGNGGLSVTQRLVDAFGMKNGLPIDDPASGYVEEGFSTEQDLRRTGWNGCERDGDNGVINKAGIYNMYCNREPRFYLAVFYNGAWYQNPDANRAHNVEFFKGGKDNDGTHDAPQNGYLMRKRHNPTDNRGQSYAYRPDIIMRLGEAYLNYAEALNESDRRDADEVLAYVNRIRERAGVRPYTTGATTDVAIHVDNDRGAMRDIIRRERHIELCCEGIRFDDLRRWKLAETMLTGAMEGMDFEGTDAATFYRRIPIKYQSRRVFEKRQYWFPIAQEHIDKNPNLVQMPYWQ